MMSPLLARASCPRSLPPSCDANRRLVVFSAKDSASYGSPDSIEDTAVKHYDSSLSSLSPQRTRLNSCKTPGGTGNSGGGARFGGGGGELTRSGSLLSIISAAAAAAIGTTSRSSSERDKESDRGSASTTTAEDCANNVNPDASSLGSSGGGRKGGRGAGGERGRATRRKRPASRVQMQMDERRCVKVCRFFFVNTFHDAAKAPFYHDT